MEWQQAWREERAALMRLVALLQAFAGLAERAAGRSALVRGIVLWVLRRAERIAGDYVFGDDDMPLAEGHWPALAPAGNRPEDALRLAEIFRALAWQLEAYASLLVTPGDGAAVEPALPLRPRRAATTLAALATFFTHAHPLRVRAPDTS